MALDSSRSGAEFECPGCGRGLVSFQGAGRPTCPRCHESFTVQVGDGFVLVEDDGWVVTLSLPASTGRRVEREPWSDSTP
jgi:protein-arginine kinase activator protein McsA